MSAFLRAAIILGSLIGLSCAGQVSPSGGPPDKSPPQVFQTYPVPGTLHFRENKLRIEFNKYVDRRKFQDAVFISPPVGRLTYDWGGKGVEISFPDSLRPDATYILSIGTDVEDTRGNRLDKTFALAFSTGDHIDSNRISGAVLDPSPEGITIFAYRLDGLNPDTLNPSTTRPHYVSQTGSSGTFTLTHLAPGAYRLIAVKDEYKNFLYDPQTDRFGVLRSDLRFPPGVDSVSGVQFRMTIDDTTRPFLSSVRAVDIRHVLLRFSEPMDTAGTSIERILIEDTLRQGRLAVSDLSFMDGGSLDVQLVTADQESTMAYRVTLSGWRDRQGNLLAGPNANNVFTGSRLPDTTRPVFRLPGIADSMRNFVPGDTIQVLFSEAILRLPFEHGFQLLDSARKRVAGRIEWQTSTGAIFDPVNAPAFGEWYTLILPLDSLIDFSGNSRKDSLWHRRFETIPSESLGTLKGMVLEDDMNGRGNVHISASEISRKNVEPYRIVLPRPGSFVFDHVREGMYVMDAFRDADSSGEYTYGKPFPFRPSERFTVYPETLKVRARWPLEGITLHFQR